VTWIEPRTWIISAPIVKGFKSPKIANVIITPGLRIEKETIFTLTTYAKSQGIYIIIYVGWSEGSFELHFPLLDYKDVPGGPIDLRSFCRRDGEFAFDHALAELLCAIARLTIYCDKGSYEFVLEFLSPGSPHITLRAYEEHDDLMDEIGEGRELPWTRNSE